MELGIMKFRRILVGLDLQESLEEHMLIKHNPKNTYIVYDLHWNTFKVHKMPLV
jgi:hypothetical protein